MRGAGAPPGASWPARGNAGHNPEMDDDAQRIRRRLVDPPAAVSAVTTRVKPPSTAKTQQGYTSPLSGRR